MRFIYLFCLTIFFYQPFFGQTSTDFKKQDSTVSNVLKNLVSVDIPPFYLNEMRLNYIHFFGDNSVSISVGLQSYDNFRYSLFENKNKYKTYSNLSKTFNRVPLQEGEKKVTRLILGASYKMYIQKKFTKKFFPFIGIRYDFKKTGYTVNVASFGSNIPIYLNSERIHNDLLGTFGFVKLKHWFYLESSIDLGLSHRNFKSYKYVNNMSGSNEFVATMFAVNQVYTTINIKLGIDITYIFDQYLSKNNSFQ